MIEDEPLSNQALVRALRDTGAIVEQATNSEKAFEILKHYDFDIVILELMICDMGEYEIVRWMRYAHQYPSVDIIQFGAATGSGSGICDWCRRFYYKAVRRLRVHRPHTGCCKA